MRLTKILRAIPLIAAALQLSGCAYHLGGFFESADSPSDSTGVVVTPVHHLGKDFSVERVYVNQYPAGAAWQGGGGGSRSCCVLLPAHWRPGLVAKVTWTVLDWRNEKVEETKTGIHQSITVDSAYEVEVPVEYYASPETMYVHIFKGGKARVVSSIYAAWSERHPISSDESEEKLATPGKRIREHEYGHPWNGW